MVFLEDSRRRMASLYHTAHHSKLISEFEVSGEG